MQQATGRRERKNIKRIAVICAVLLILAFVISELKPWSRKPADAGECSEHDAAWRQNALKSKLNGTDAPASTSKNFAIQDGSHWDSENHLWVVPFRTTGQTTGTGNFTALIHCTGSVDIKAGDQ
ncbi:hypothetical protein [Paraburkholderia sp. BCC1886]|uniref:hypothetical protein n=1 Tax=Paraburkholderia sp. BCC1886 TaxID=2562670 RepID=UPI0011836416|nr:hypothetical protein [Paraburkholderia sp. BCC1886]